MFFSYLLHILIQSTLKPASLPDFIEQVFIETCFVSGISLGTGDINGGQTNNVFAFVKLTARGEAYINEKILQINMKLQLWCVLLRRGYQENKKFLWINDNRAENEKN